MSNVSRKQIQGNRIGQLLAVFTDHSVTSKDPELSVYSRVLSRMPIKEDPSMPNAMAITIIGSRLHLVYNKEWVENVGWTEFASTMAHEALHVMGNDIAKLYRKLSLAPPARRRVVADAYNIAMDAGNNCNISKRRVDMVAGTSGYWVLPEGIGMPNDLHIDAYYEGLMEKRSVIDAATQAARKALEEKKSKEGEKGKGEKGPENSGDDGAPEEGDDEDKGREDGDTGQGGKEEDEDGPGESGGGGEGSGTQEGPDGQGGPGGQSDFETAKQAAMGAGAGEKLAEAIAHSLTAGAHHWDNKVGEQGEKSYTDMTGMSEAELSAMAMALEEQANAAVKGALEEHRRSAGTVPLSMQARMLELEDSFTVPWVAVLRRLVTPKLLAHRRSDMQRPSKSRYVMFVHDDESGELVRLEVPLPRYPGAKKDRVFNICMAIDVSGSMSMTDVAEGLTELRNIVKNMPGVSVTVIQADTHVQAVHTLTAVNDVSEYARKIGRRGYGGTMYDKVFSLVRAHNSKRSIPDDVAEPSVDMSELPSAAFDLVIYHTDSDVYSLDTGMNPKVPVIWLLPKDQSGKSSREMPFGKFVVRQ